MQSLAWIWLGTIAAGATYLTITTDNDRLAIISGLIGTVTWLLFAFHALDVQVFDGNNNPTTLRYPALAVWGVAMAAPNLFVALTGPLHMIRDNMPIKDGREV